MENLFFEEKEKIMSYIHFFQKIKSGMKNEEDHIHCICTHGPPGCGKTSFEKTVIYLKRHLIVIDLKIKSEQELIYIL